MNIKFEKNQSIIEIVLGEVPRIRGGSNLGSFSHRYIIESFTIDGENMGRNDDTVPYFSYEFDWVYRNKEKIFCLSLRYDLAKKVSVKLGLKKTEYLNLTLNEDITRLFTEELIPKAQILIEEAKEKQIEEIKEADRNVTDDEEVTVYISGGEYHVIINNTDYNSFLRREIAGKLNIYNDKDLFKDFPYEIGSGYSTDYHMTYKELKEVMASIEEEVKIKKAELDRIAKEKAEAEAKRKEERIKYDNSYKIVKEIKLVYPRGGEGGTDGYYRVIIKETETGEEFDVVLRNVFDFGCWAVIYNKDIDEKLPDSEKRACKWVYDHAPFTTSIRM